MITRLNIWSFKIKRLTPVATLYDSLSSQLFDSNGEALVSADQEGGKWKFQVTRLNT